MKERIPPTQECEIARRQAAALPSIEFHRLHRANGHKSPDKEELGQACLDVKPMALRAIRAIAPLLEAEDIYQHACLQAVRAQASFRGDSKFSTWFVSIAVNCARSYCRPAIGPVRTPQLFPSVEEVLNLQCKIDNPEDQAILRQRENQVLEAVMKLSQPYLVAVVARYYCDMRIEEIAGLLGTSKSAIKSRLFQARLALHAMLQ